MNIFKYKKFIATALNFVMFLVLVQQPLLMAKERRGSTVIVTMTDGSQVRGELLAVKRDALLVFDPDARQGKSLDLRQVVQVKLLKKLKLLKGLAIGLVAGVGISVLFNSTSSIQAQEYAAVTFLCVPPTTGLIGGILGAFAGMSEKFSLAGEPSRNVQQDLRRLKRYAREQDLEKPIEPEFMESMISNPGTQSHGAQKKRQFWHHFRLLWLPVQQHFNRHIDFRAENGTFRFLGSAPSKDTDVYEFKLNSRSYISDQLNVDQLRLEYELTPHFSASLEFIASGRWSRSNYMDLSYHSTDYARRTKSSILFVNEYSNSPLLLGLNWKPISPSFASKHIIELGIAAGPVQAQVNTYDSLTQNSNPLYKLKTLTWSCKVHAAYDYFCTEKFSLGVFVACQYLRASFPGATFFNEKQQFWPEDDYHVDRFIRPTEFTIPGHTIQLGGTAYGFRIGLRF